MAVEMAEESRTKGRRKNDHGFLQKGTRDPER